MVCFVRKTADLNSNSWYNGLNTLNWEYTYYKSRRTISGMSNQWQSSKYMSNTLSLLSVISHCMLLDVAFTSKTHKPLTDQGLEETQTKSSQEDKSTPSIIKTTGNNVNYIL